MSAAAAPRQRTRTSRAAARPATLRERRAAKAPLGRSVERRARVAAKRRRSGGGQTLGAALIRDDIEGVSHDEAAALAPDDKTLAYMEEVWRRASKSLPQNEPVPPSPYPEDVRLKGEIPQGTQPFLPLGSEAAAMAASVETGGGSPAAPAPEDGSFAGPFASGPEVIPVGATEEVRPFDFDDPFGASATAGALSGDDAAALEAAVSAPTGSPEHQKETKLRADLGTLLSTAEALVESYAERGIDVETARGELDMARAALAAVAEEGAGEMTRKQALALKREVLRAQLRPMTAEEVSEQLAGWLALLKEICIEVSDLEKAALESEEGSDEASLSERAVRLRGERGRLIDRVNDVISALEDKGGDVASAKAYVGSVVATPPITGYRAALSPSLAWLQSPDVGSAVGIYILSAIVILFVSGFISRIVARVVRRAMKKASKLAVSPGLRTKLMSRPIESATNRLGSSSKVGSSSGTPRSGLPTTCWAMVPVGGNGPPAAVWENGSPSRVSTSMPSTWPE